MKQSFKLIPVVTLFISALYCQARETRFGSAYRASLHAVAELKLDSIQQCTDSIAVRLTSVDSSAGRITIYDLRNSPEKSISLIYWAEAKQHSRKRLFGLIKPKIWYSAHYQVGMLYPYQKVDAIIAELPQCVGTSPVATTRACSMVQSKNGQQYSSVTCGGGDCRCVDAMQEFVDKYFFYERN